MILFLDLYDDLIYLLNLVKICALQKHEFKHVLQIEILLFDALKGNFNLFSKCCRISCMGHLDLIKQDFIFYRFK